MEASARTSVNQYGENGVLDTPNGSLRNRRKDRAATNDSSVQDWGGSSRSSPHPLLPLPGVSDSNTDQRGREATLGASPSITNFDEISRPSLFRLTSDLEREVHAANVISRSSVDDTSLRGSLDQRRSSSVRESPKEVEVIVHEVSGFVSCQQAL